MSIIVDITSEVKGSDWSKGGKVILSQNPKHGLYLFSFNNKLNLAIHDRNIKSGNGGLSGKQVVPPCMTTLKFGKFENYLKSRFSQYHKHMHYLGDSESLIHQEVFKQSIERVYLLSLPGNLGSDERIFGAHIFEPLWNSCISQFLHKQSLLTEVQNSRSEYRNTIPLAPYYLELEDLLNRTADTIFAIRETIAIKFNNLIN